MIVCLVQITSLKLLAGVFEVTQSSHLGLLRRSYGRRSPGIPHGKGCGGYGQPQP